MASENQRREAEKAQRFTGGTVVARLLDFCQPAFGKSADSVTKQSDQDYKSDARRELGH